MRLLLVGLLASFAFGCGADNAPETKADELVQSSDATAEEELIVDQGAEGDLSVGLSRCAPATYDCAPKRNALQGAGVLFSPAINMSYQYFIGPFTLANAQAQCSTFGGRLASTVELSALNAEISAFLSYTDSRGKLAYCTIDTWATYTTSTKDKYGKVTTTTKNVIETLPSKVINLSPKSTAKAGIVCIYP